MINQLFQSIPSRALLQELIACFGLTRLDDPISFTKFDMLRIDTIGKVTALKPRLMGCWLPCKQRLYWKYPMKLHNCITILRQVARLFEYNLNFHERSLTDRKIILYRLKPFTTVTTAIIAVTNEVRVIRLD